MGWTRASQLDRTLQCLASTFLWNTKPELRLQPRSENSVKAAEYGTMVHKWAETGIVEGSESHVKTFNKKLVHLSDAGIDRLDVWPDTGYHEVAVAYHCVDGRVDIQHEGDGNVFKSAHSEPWVTGSLDYYSVSGGILAVDDLKTGMLFDKAPDEIAQTYFYLMCLNKYYRFETDSIASITHWPKYPLESLPYRTKGDIPKALLDEFEDLLKRSYAKYKSDPMQFRVGAECDWCPVKKAGICPLVRS